MTKRQPLHFSTLKDYVTNDGYQISHNEEPELWGELEAFVNKAHSLVNAVPCTVDVDGKEYIIYSVQSLVVPVQLFFENDTLKIKRFFRDLERANESNDFLLA